MSDSTAIEPWVARLEEAPLVALLPVVRVVRAAGTCSLDRAREVLAIHADRLLAFRVRRLKALPPELFEPGSLHAWHTQHRLEPHADLALDQIAHAAITGPEIYGNRLLMGRERGYLLRVTATDGAAFELRLPEDDAQAVIIALRTLLGARFAEAATLPPLPTDTRRLLPAPRSPLLRLLIAVTAIAAPLLAFSIIWHRVKISPLTGWSSVTALLVVIAFGGSIVFTALRNLHSGYAEKQRAERRRAKRKARPVHAGEEPVRSPHLSWLLKGLGTAALFGAFILALLIPMWMPIHHFDGLLQALVYVPATLLIYYGYRLSLRSASEVREGDSRPPILYLRSFGLDGRNNLNPPGFVAQMLGIEPPWLLRWLGPIGNIYPLRLVRLLFSRAADHAEEQLATFFQGLGPFIAIGRPGDRLAIGGAARVYLEDADWRAAVQRLMDEAQLIVIQPDDSEQMWWEIRETFHRTKPENVLFLLIGYEGAQWRYERFRLRFEQTTGRILPRALGDGVFLHFTPAGSQLLALSRLPHITWPVAGCSVDFPRTLAPFLAAREGRTAPVASVSPLFVRAFSALAALWIWILGLSVLYYIAAQPAFQWKLRQETQAMLREAASESGRTVHHIQVDKPKYEPYGLRPPLPQYTVAIPKSWTPPKERTSLFKPRNVPLDIVAGRGWNERKWGFRDLVECVISVAPEAPPSVTTSEEYTAQVLAELQREMRAVTVLGESTERHDGRTWHTTRLRTFGGGMIFPEEEMKHGVLSIPDQERFTTLRTYVGPHGAMQVRTSALASMPREIEPVLAQIFTSFHYESPVERMEAAARAERAAFIAQERKNVEALQPNLRPTTRPSPRFRYSLTLGENWQASTSVGGADMVFLLSPQIGCAVQMLNLAAFPTPPTTAQALADSMMTATVQNSGGAMKIDDRQTVTLEGLTWERVRYRDTTPLLQQQFTSWFTVSGGLGLHLTGWTQLRSTEAHDEVIDPVFAGFKLLR